MQNTVQVIIAEFIFCRDFGEKSNNFLMMNLERSFLPPSEGLNSTQSQHKRTVSNINHELNAWPRSDEEFPLNCSYSWVCFVFCFCCMKVGHKSQSSVWKHFPFVWFLMTSFSQECVFRNILQIHEEANLWPGFNSGSLQSQNSAAEW